MDRRLFFPIFIISEVLFVYGSESKMAVFCLSKTSVFLFILVCILLACIQESNAKPPWLSPGSDVFTESAECHTDDELLDLCQRCAKLTKSRLAYPACCSTDLQARKWCSDYVYFGRDKYDFYLI